MVTVNPGRPIAITDVRGQITTGRVVTETVDAVTVRKAHHRVDVRFDEIVASDEIDPPRNGVIGLIVATDLFVAEALVLQAGGIGLGGAR